ncbi:MAG: PASTA domain-containing protein [Sedimentisphaerales bacterium]|nr:PASTA domain-containing protein [Sedimentisphaerales bacterium]
MKRKQMRAWWYGILLVLLIFVAGGEMGGNCAFGEDITISFQQGGWWVNDVLQGVYEGVTDVTIYHPSFGSIPPDRLYVWRYFNPYNEVNNSLLRFDNLQTYVDSALIGLGMESAELTGTAVQLTYRHVSPDYTTAIIDLYECTQDWTSAATWTKYDGTASWDSAGAKGAGDRGELLVHLDMGYRSTTVQYADGTPYNFILDIAKVQSWLDTPATNQGLLYTMAPGANTYVAFASSEDETIVYRPLLILTFTTPPPPPMEVPDVMGLIRADAEKLLVSAGLGATIDAPYGDTPALDFVMEQNPAPGEMAPAGSAVTLTVVTCDFTDDNQVDLEDFAMLAGDWLVCQTATPTNLDLSENNCVDFNDLLWFIPWFTQDVTTTEVPSVVGLTETAAQTTLSVVGLNAHIIRLPSDTVPAGDAIYMQAPQAGSEAPEGGTVDIYISLGATPGDFNESEFVDAADLALLAGEWLAGGDTLTTDMDNSGKVDLGDFAIFASYWLMDYNIPE